MSKAILARSKAHTRYYLNDGTLVVGVSTVTSLEGGEKTGFLCKWANNLGLDGVSYSSYMDNIANLGTLVHYLCECDLRGVEPDLSDYTPNEIREAKISFKKFRKWLNNQKEFEPILLESELISEKYKYGGTCDIYAKLNGRLTLIDLKTSNAIREGHKVQVSAYEYLLKENSHPVDDVMILRIGRKESEGFQTVEVTQRDLRFKKFLRLLEVYRINKELKKGS